MEFAAENIIRIFGNVNVFAAVCLLLLVGVLTPSSAAPHMLQTMDRSKNPASDQENAIWSNPCRLNQSVLYKPVPYKPKLAENVAMQLRDTLYIAKGYKSEITNMSMGVNAFEDILKMWQHTPWLQIQLPLEFSNDILPENKKFGTPVDDKTLDKMMTYEKLAEVLPRFSKTMKMLGAALQSISSVLLNKFTYGNIKVNLERTSNSIRHVLCLTNGVIRTMNMKILPLKDSDIPQYSGLSTEEVEKNVFLIYRDTVNFLEYAERFFEKLSKTELKFKYNL